jgi:hypothetical protein
MRANGLTASDLVMAVRQPNDGPRFEWRSIDRRYWQAQAPKSDAQTLSEIDAEEGTSAGCASGMVRVSGNHRLELHGEATGEIERLQDAACTDWISREFPARCRTYDREAIEREVAKLPVRALDFCIDRFEYPNALGQNPVIVVGFREAEALCRAAGKRLCTETEWTFACEGEEVLPYPYGYARDATACVVDRAWRPFKEGALSPRDGEQAKAELDRLWQGEPSGSRLGCKSPFGVYDMTGNVDEWTTSVRSTGYRSILKGGYWGPVRARCRPSTRAHDEGFVAYQQGFRCCASADASIPPPRRSPSIAERSDAGPTPPPATGARTATTAGTASFDAVDRAPRQLSAEEELDELRAIEKARVGLGCSATPGR